VHLEAAGVAAVGGGALKLLELGSKGAVVHGALTCLAPGAKIKRIDPELG
jgi:hypothetical protein